MLITGVNTTDFSPESLADGSSPSSMPPGHASSAVAYSPPLRGNLPRMASLPCTSAPPLHPGKCLTKSHSLDEVPESLRLQQLYDSYTYRERVRKVAQEVFHKGSKEDPPADFDGPAIEDPLGMVSLDGPRSDNTLTDNSSEQNVSGSDDNVSPSAKEMGVGVGEDGSDLAKVKAMEEFDQATSGITADPIESNTVHEKLEQLKLSDSSKTPERGYEPLQPLASPDLGAENNVTCASSEQTKKMASFFAKYAEEMASLNCDVSGQEGASSGQTQTNSGDFVDSGESGSIVPQEGMVFCGHSVVEGEEMAILLDTRLNRYFAVDPTTLDPGFYHHQQLSHYMQYQGEMSVNKDNSTY